MDSEEEEEEESMQDMGNQDHPLPKKTDRSLQKNPMMSKPGSNPHAKDSEEEEEETVLLYNGKRYKLERGDAAGGEEEEEEEEATVKAEDEEEEEERQRPHRIKQHGPSPHMPGKPIGKQGSKANPATRGAGDAH